MFPILKRSCLVSFTLKPLALIALSAAGSVSCQHMPWPEIRTVHINGDAESESPAKVSKQSAKGSERTKTSSKKDTAGSVGPLMDLQQVWAQGSPQLEQYCFRELSQLPGQRHIEALSQVCHEVEVKKGCESVAGRPIFHYDKKGTSDTGKKIFAMALIHGDEIPSGSVARSWMERLHGISSRNHWRVMPIANPDGLKLGTRMNAHGVDLNRNFPSEDWEEDAIRKWIEVKNKDPRRNPGKAPASEQETQCFIRHFKDFDPDFIISIHTPLAVLDFDGPKVKFPNFSPLPWISLGTFPGSLGRYMWEDEGTPVLTIELTPDGGVEKLAQFDRLQDISGTVAIQADKMIRRKKSSKSHGQGRNPTQD